MQVVLALMLLVRMKATKRVRKPPYCLQLLWGRQRGLSDI